MQAESVTIAVINMGKYGSILSYLSECLNNCWVTKQTKEPKRHLETVY